MRDRHLVASALLAIALCGSAPIARREVLLQDRFRTSPYAPGSPRWCERYHHGHWTGRDVRFTASASDPSECTRDDGPLSSRSCVETGCDACGSVGSPCSKVGEPQGNAVIQTTTDTPGDRYSITATFVVERDLPVGNTHLGLYAALHPHCHTTVQAILVPDRPGEYHLNVAAFNQFIGGDRAVYRSCVDHPLSAISPPLADGIRLIEGRAYRWTLTAHLDAAADIVASSSVEDARDARLAAGSHVFTGSAAGDWFGVGGRGARFAFGAQLSTRPSPSGGAPAVRLTEVRASVAADPARRRRSSLPAAADAAQDAAVARGSRRPTTGGSTVSLSSSVR